MIACKPQCSALAGSNVSRPNDGLMQRMIVGWPQRAIAGRLL